MSMKEQICKLCVLITGSYTLLQKKCTGGDETEISVEFEKWQSSLDRAEPQIIEFVDSDGDGTLDPLNLEIDAKVCGIDCSSTSEPDVIDVFKIDNIFAGEEVTIKFASREDDYGDYDLRMYYREDYYLSSGLNYSFYEIDDSGDWNDNKLVTTYTHTMDKSGALYIWFIAGFDSDVKDWQSYTIEFPSKGGLVIETADLDQDGLPDYEEYSQL